jgi:hypothetical protein
LGFFRRHHGLFIIFITPSAGEEAMSGVERMQYFWAGWYSCAFVWYFFEFVKSYWGRR